MQPYLSGASKLHVLVNASLFCMQTTGSGSSATCIDDGSGAPIEGAAAFDDDAATWVAVSVALGAKPNQLIVDLSATNGTAHAIRYAWAGDCCSENPPTSGPCPIASCPIMAGDSKLPANPFIAKIVASSGKCACIPPQVCDE